jgi:hypothetical protein
MIHNYEKIIKDLEQLFYEAERRKYKVRWILFIFIIGIGLLFYEIIRDWMIEQGSEITTQSLKDPMFQNEIYELCNKTLIRLSKDEDVINSVSSLLEEAIIKVSKREDLQNELAEMFKIIFQTELIKNDRVN